MTLDAVRNLLLRHAKEFATYKNSTGVKAWCRSHGVSNSHACEFLNGQRNPTSDLLEALGLEWRVMRKAVKGIAVSDGLKVGMKVVANAGGLGWSYRAEIEDIYNGKALLLPLEIPFTASSARTGHYKKRRRWVHLDRLETMED